MKDRKLEEQFNGYFEGINPPENLAEDAKRYVKAPSRLPRLYKFVSVAASFIVVFAAALLIILNPLAAQAPRDEIQAPDDFDMSGVASVAYYTEDDVTLTAVNGYALASVDPSLKFMEKFAYASNADITAAEKAIFGNGETAFVKAEIVRIAGARYDAEIYVDFSDRVYEPLSEYLNGEGCRYYGLYYRLTGGEVNGEPNYKVYAVKDGIQYFISVTSSDTESYLKFLEIIF